MISRRAFLACVWGFAVAWPTTAHAQSERVRRVGMLLSPAESDPSQQARNAAFRDRLQALGWVEGRNLGIDIRWAQGDPALFRRYAEELVATSPDVIVGMSAAALDALRESTTRSIPIVFQFIPDPVAQGYVESLARPGGTMTGFANFDLSLAGKWLQVLKDLIPATRQVLLIYNREITKSYWQPGFEATAASQDVGFSFVQIRDIGALPVSLAAFAKRGDLSVIVLPDAFAAGHRDAYIAAIAAARLPAIYTNDAFPRAGGLASYGPDLLDLFRQGADMVDRILRGESPANIPVRNPAKYEFVVNLKTAQTLGITVAPSVLYRADEVIE